MTAPVPILDQDDEQQKLLEWLGKYAFPREACAQALALGAYAVVVGGAITRPQWITAQFADALKGIKP